MTYTKMEELIGRTLVSVQKTDFDGNDALRFEDTEGNVYWLGHHQDCCEWVGIEDIDGDLEDLVGAPIVQAEEVAGAAPREQPEFGDWTFYKFATTKGYVWLRWFGESEYYSTAVSFWREGDRPW